MPTAKSTTSHKIVIPNTGWDTLKKAETSFFDEYPGGFQHPELVAIGKKHNVDKLAGFVQDELSKEAFSNTEQVLQDLTRIVSRSTMVSLFEKPKFRDMVHEMDDAQKQNLAQAIYEQYYGNKEKGFNLLIDTLAEFKLAKWTLASVFLAYFNMQEEVFVKPSTAKLIIEKLQLPLQYKPKPSWEFYVGFKDAVHQLRAKSDESVAPNMPAYCGFLMMSL